VKICVDESQPILGALKTVERFDAADEDGTAQSPSSNVAIEDIQRRNILGRPNEVRVDGPVVLISLDGVDAAIDTLADQFSQWTAIGR